MSEQESAYKPPCGSKPHNISAAVDQDAQAYMWAMTGSTAIDTEIIKQSPLCMDCSLSVVHGESGCLPKVSRLGPKIRLMQMFAEDDSNYRITPIIKGTSNWRLNP